MARPKFSDSAVARVFASYPTETKARLHALRDEIYQVAAEINGVGLIEEALCWQQPSYLTQETGSGSPVRIDVIKGQPNKYAIYFHCQTGLVDHFKQFIQRHSNMKETAQ